MPDVALDVAGTRDDAEIRHKDAVPWNLFPSATRAILLVATQRICPLICEYFRLREDWKYRN
jgi:hypothetical protein